MTRTFLLVLTSLLLLVACAPKRNSCPPFPLPSAHVQQQMDRLAAGDREVWEWGNKLLDLCQQLGTCEDEGMSIEKTDTP